MSSKEMWTPGLWSHTETFPESDGKVSSTGQENKEKFKCDRKGAVFHFFLHLTVLVSDSTGIGQSADIRSTDNAAYIQVRHCVSDVILSEAAHVSTCASVNM